MPVLDRAREPEPRVAVARLVEIQRARLIAGAIEAIDEVGYQGATVGHITRHASVSRRTFYELFADREACLAAVLEEIVSRIARELDGAGLDRLPWLERIRTGLWRMLAFCDREPAPARVCVVQALRGGPRVLERREQLLAELAAAVDSGRRESARGAGCAPLTAEGLVGAAFSIVYARLLRHERAPLTNLSGELMALIALPYLGPGAARRELARQEPVATGSRIDRPWPAPTATGANAGPERQAPPDEDPLQGVRMRLTYRTARVLVGVAAHPHANNRAVADYAGVADPGQISKLLARLERVGLLVNTGGGHARGEPNAWTLTPRGELLARRIENATNDACVAQAAGALDSVEER